MGDEELEMNGHVDETHFERNPQGIFAGVKIRQLRKVNKKSYLARRRIELSLCTPS